MSIEACMYSVTAHSLTDCFKEHRKMPHCISFQAFEQRVLIIHRNYWSGNVVKPLPQTSSSCHPCQPCLRRSSSSLPFASPKEAEDKIKIKITLLFSLLVILCKYAGWILTSVSALWDEAPTSSLSSFLTCFRLDLRSMDTLCLEPSRAASMASADIRTLLRTGFLKYFPFRSWTFDFRSPI